MAFWACFVKLTLSIETPVGTFWARDVTLGQKWHRLCKVYAPFVWCMLLLLCTCALAKHAKKWRKSGKEFISYAVFPWGKAHVLLILLIWMTRTMIYQLHRANLKVYVCTASRIQNEHEIICNWIKISITNIWDELTWMHVNRDSKINKLYQLQVLMKSHIFCMLEIRLNVLKLIERESGKLMMNTL